MADLGLPNITIIFKQKALSMRQRSQKGIGAIILKDDTVTGDSFVYRSYDEIKESWSSKNLKYLEFCFKDSQNKVAPSKLYVERIGTTSPDLDSALKKLSNRTWHYLAMPEAETADNTKIVAFIKTKRNTDFKVYKFVGGGLTAPDDKGIINWDSNNVSINNTKYTKAEYSARIMGICAGIPVDRSLTNYALSEVESFDELEDDTARNQAIASGKMIALNDGEEITIARGINSKTTVTTDEGDIFKKIRIVETIDIMREDIYDTIKKYYQGKKVNTYNNKLILAGDITDYLKELARLEILDPDSSNECIINFEAQKEWLRSKGYKVDDMSDIEILKSNTDDNVFLTINSKATDVMENFSIDIFV